MTAKQIRQEIANSKFQIEVLKKRLIDLNDQEEELTRVELINYFTAFQWSKLDLGDLQSVYESINGEQYELI